jgi:hypothetical protein
MARPESRSTVSASLKHAGFVVLPDLFSAEESRRLATAYDNAISKASAPDLRTSRNSSQVRLANLVRYDSAFKELRALEPVLEACELVIGEGFKLSGLRARTVLPGGAAEALHVDVAVDSPDWPLVGFIVMVDDFRPENGATRFVPGSHRWAKDWRGITTNDRPSDAPQVTACGTAGSVIVFDGSTWHGHGANVTSKARRSIQGTYIPPHGTCAEAHV